MRLITRVAVLDDHPAVRAGVAAILGPKPDLVLVGSAADEEELWPLLRRARPSVVVLDLHHPGRDGLTLCLQIKRGLHPPAVVLYSATTTPAELVVAAAVAGADAVVRKSATARELVEAIRAAAEAPDAPAPVSAQMRAEAAARLDPADHAVLAMRLAGDSPAAIGAMLGLTVAAVADRIREIVARLMPADLMPSAEAA
jgi:DNA-binding NarL/FixJ family response regulator